MTFSKQINYGDWKLQALFEQVYGPKEKFFVVLSDGHSDVARFDMVKHLDHWIVINPAPDWVISFQNELSLTINNTDLN